MAGLLAVAASGCTTAQPSVTPSIEPTPGATASATPTASPSPIFLTWPTDSAIELAGGRYASAPPFDVPFTIDIPAGQGWGSAHLHGEFFDFVNVTEIGVQPTRWVAFAHPESIYGMEAASSTGLSPRAAAELLAGLDDVVAGPISEATLVGLGGVRLDLATGFPNVHLFGGPGGQFTLDPDYELRLMLLPHDAHDDLLLVLVLAPHGELDAAWAEVQPILDTIEF